MGEYIKAADMIRDAFDCIVVIVHHSPHDGDRPRGTFLAHGRARRADRRYQGRATTTSSPTLELAKDMEVGLRFVSRLEKVELGKDATVTGRLARREGGRRRRRAQEGQEDQRAQVGRRLQGQTGHRRRL